MRISSSFLGTERTLVQVPSPQLGTIACEILRRTLAPPWHGPSKRRREGATEGALRRRTRARTRAHYACAVQRALSRTCSRPQAERHRTASWSTLAFTGGESSVEAAVLLY
eukprot:6197551-Pleurochrysis_carterae.AAC.1